MKVSSFGCGIHCVDSIGDDITGLMSHMRMGWMASAPNRRALRQTAAAIFCKERSPTMEVTTVGLDLGKDVFQSHGVTTDGTVVFNRSIRRR